MKAACFSVACVDYYLHEQTYYAGGESLNQAVHFSHLGDEAAFVGAVGTDAVGGWLRQFMGSRGIDLTRMTQLPGVTANNQITIEADGEKHEVEGAWVDGAYGEYHFTEEDWAYLAGFDIWATHAYIMDYEETLKRKTAHQLLAVDFLESRDYEQIEHGVQFADIVGISGIPEMIDPLARMAKQHSDKIIVLTLGAGGSIAFNGSQRYEQAALPLDIVVDTTGCGDAFHAAFTHTYAHTRDIPQALLAGAELARITAGHVGTVKGGRFSLT